MEKTVDQRLITNRVIEGKPKHDVVYSAATGKDGKIYLGLSSEIDIGPGIFAQIISYDPETDKFEDIADLGKIIKESAETARHPHSKIHTAICAGNDGENLRGHTHDRPSGRGGFLSLLECL